MTNIAGPLIETARCCDFFLCLHVHVCNIFMQYTSKLIALLHPIVFIKIRAHKVIIKLVVFYKNL